MANFFSDPEKMVAVQLKEWLDQDPSHNLDIEKWRRTGPMRLQAEGISRDTYDWIMKNGFQHVRGLMEKIKKAYKDAPRHDRHKELVKLQHDFDTMQERSLQTNQRQMIILMQMQDRSIQDISFVLGKSENFVESEIKRMQTKGWCGK